MGEQAADDYFLGRIHSDGGGDEQRVLEWEIGLPFGEHLMPLSKSLLSPQLASAFSINPEPARTLIDVHRAFQYTVSNLRRLAPSSAASAALKSFDPFPSPPPPDDDPMVFEEEEDTPAGGEESSSRKLPRLESDSPSAGSAQEVEEAAESSATRPESSGEDSARTLKRARLVWTPQLHKRFVDVVSHLSIKNAVPKTIVQLMNVEGLTRENVASHLQKYRLYVKRTEDVPNEGTDHMFASTRPPAAAVQQHSRSDQQQASMPFPMPYTMQGMFPMPVYGMAHPHGLQGHALLYSLLMPVMSQYAPGLEKGKGMYLLFVKSEAKTPGGLVARPVLTSYYKSRHFVDRPFDPYNVYTSPNEAVLCQDSYQSMYAQLLCGLVHRDEVLRVGAVFASGFIRAIRFLEKHWPRLCRDIRSGELDAEITDKTVRNAVAGVLRPDPDLADRVEVECSKGSWHGIIRRLWPNTKYVDVIVTGAMAQYIPTLDFYSNGLPLTCTMYASSECYFGLNLKPMCKPSEVSYTLIPTMAYFEFLPVKSACNGDFDFDHRDLIDLVDVKLGQEYELVVTTYAGLYRYRVGDVLRVAGFKNKAPQFTFVRRKNVALSIDSDKTDEVELHAAVTNAVHHLEYFGTSLVEYTSYADSSSIPGHYVLFWELQAGGETPVPPSVFEDCCLTVEESLNSVYRQGRVSDKSIGPLEIRVVEEGTFDKLMDYALSQGASINQYKAPRCVRPGPVVELLDSRVQSRFFSPKCPKWTPGNRQWTKENGNM